MTTLYVASGACSFGAHVVLKELGIPHKIEIVPLRVPDSPIFKVNPLGRVPTLQLESGEVITENGAILPYLADLKPEAGLIAPAGSVERAPIQEWIGFLNSDVHGALKPINRPNLFHPDESAHQAIREQSKPRLLEFLKVIDGKLAGKTWAVGERFTIADAYLNAVRRPCRRRNSPRRLRDRGSQEISAYRGDAYRDILAARGQIMRLRRPPSSSARSKPILQFGNLP